MYITSTTGKHFDPINPDKNLIDIVDIAHSLSLICRANGHFKSFYSVASHSIACSIEAEKRGFDKKIQLACLLHDASEAYLSDVTRPIKAMLTKYLEVEDKLQNTIWEKYLGFIPDEEDRRKIFGVDDDMLSLEFLNLMPEKLGDRYKNIISEVNFEFVPMEVTEKRFIDRFYELTL